MKNSNITLEDICFEFQQNIVNIFNNEQNIPFILKYYLFKDIWDNIQKQKINKDIETHSKLESITETMVTDQKKDTNQE